MSDRPAKSRARAELESLHAEMARELLDYLWRRSGPDDSADLLAETFLVAWRRIAELPKEPERRRMWMYVTARNVLANWQRGRSRHVRLTQRLRETLQSLPVNERQGLTEVRDAVKDLPIDQRELVMLVHWEGFTVTEAAQILGVSESTARGRYQRARSRLLRALDTLSQEAQTERPN